MEAVIVPLLIVIALLCARLERQAREVVALPAYLVAMAVHAVGKATA